MIPATAPTPPNKPIVLTAVDPNLNSPNHSAVPSQSTRLDQDDPNKADSNNVFAAPFSDTSIQDTAPSSKGNIFSGFTFETLAFAMRFLNALLVLTATLYCLSLFFSLELTMQGRLGGINHISKAFFLSLLTLVLLFPWQNIFGNMILGATYSPGELAQAYSREVEHTYERVLYYLRFTGFGVLLLLLFVLSQVRSVRWTKAILHRLDII
jgi:hypothetical protein